MRSIGRHACNSSKHFNGYPSPVSFVPEISPRAPLNFCAICLPFQLQFPDCYSLPALSARLVLLPKRLVKVEPPPIHKMAQSPPLPNEKQPTPIKCWAHGSALWRDWTLSFLIQSLWSSPVGLQRVVMVILQRADVILLYVAARAFQLISPGENSLKCEDIQNLSPWNGNCKKNQ